MVGVLTEDEHSNTFWGDLEKSTKPVLFRGKNGSAQGTLPGKEVTQCPAGTGIKEFLQYKAPRGGDEVVHRGWILSEFVVSGKG
jgi:hypothetical protein